MERKVERSCRGYTDKILWRNIWRTEYIYKKKLSFIDEFNEYDESWTEEKRQQIIKNHPGKDAEKIAEIIYKEDYAYKTPYIPDARFQHALYLLNLQKSGYPFTGDDLTMEEWYMISELKAMIEEKQIEEMKSKSRFKQ